MSCTSFTKPLIGRKVCESIREVDSSNAPRRSSALPPRSTFHGALALLPLPLLALPVPPACPPLPSGSAAALPGGSSTRANAKRSPKSNSTAYRRPRHSTATTSSTPCNGPAPNFLSSSASSSDQGLIAAPEEKSSRGRRERGRARRRLVPADSGATCADMPEPMSDTAWPMFEIGLKTPLAKPWPTPTTAPPKPRERQPSAGFFTTSSTPSRPSPSARPASAIPSATPRMRFSARMRRCLATYSSSKVSWFKTDAASPATSPMPSVR
mmetsp:Transcript_159684/g.387713  ORF Transcript_159684/g.387713 Transcript_159684/m.387713 type:complete len:268 (-) Transcript_159684:579-1382(-)